MKFLLDACAASKSLRKFLVDLGHDVISALDADLPLSDQALLEWSLRERRVLVTKDKDFGELIFVRHLPHSAVIRLVEMTNADELKAMQELLMQYSEKLKENPIVVVTKDRIRIRI